MKATGPWLAALLLAACSKGADGRDEGLPTGVPAESDSSGGVSATGGSTSMSSEGTGGGSASDSDSTSGAGETGGNPKFDLPLPDGGGDPVFPGIPETCAQAVMIESTVGCSFHANKMQNFIEEPTSLVLGNVSDSNTATVQLYQGVGGAEQTVGTPVTIPPLGTHEFVLDSPSEPGAVSVHRTGGAFRAQSDIPVVAYQHSPIAAEAHNDSSMLIPDHAAGENFIVASWQESESMFNVVALQDDTSVTWTSPYGTASGSGVPAGAPNAPTTVSLDHYDLLQVIANTDASGTIISADKPVWVVGAVPCVNIPNNVTFCDHIEEQMLPLAYWGETYVGAHAPTRGSERYYWRIFSGDQGVTITTNPPQPNTPVTLDRGEFVEFDTTQSFMIDADGPIMPVQYLEGQNGGAGTGDPASYQMVPVEQFLTRYVFVTGTGYTENYVQIIRESGGADVTVDGVTVTGYTPVGNYEVSDWLIGEGSHVADSPQPFGVIQVGYTGVTSYAYPGGLRLEQINPNPEG